MSTSALWPVLSVYILEIIAKTNVMKSFTDILSKILTVSSLTFKSFVDFELTFLYGIKVQFQSFAYEDPVLTLSFVQETILSPLYILGTLVKNQSTVCIWIYFRVLYFIYSYVCQYHSCTVLITVTFVLYSKVRKYYTSRFVLSQG